MIHNPGGLAALLGNPGERYKIVSAPLQNAGSPNYWQPIAVANHEAINVDSVSTSAGTGLAPGAITVNYGSINAKDVCTWLIVPDETLAVNGFAAGASVGLTSAVINLAQASGVADQVSYNGTAWVFSKASPCFSAAWSTDHLVLTHPQVGGAFGVSLEPRSLDGTTRPYLPVVAQSSGIGATSTAIEFWNQATGAKVTAPDTNMKLIVTRTGMGQVDPRPVDTTAYPNSNLWFVGLFRV